MYVILLGKERKEHGGLNSGVVLILGWFKVGGLLYCIDCLLTKWAEICLIC